jgi:hypothetical protein
MKSPSGVSQRSLRSGTRGGGKSDATIVCRWPPGSHQGAEKGVRAIFRSQIQAGLFQENRS